MPNIAKCSIFVGSTALVTLGGFMIALWPAIHDLVLHYVSFTLIVCMLIIMCSMNESYEPLKLHNLF
jgi:hypothetical protein